MLDLLNSPLLYLIAGAVVLYVVLISVIFLIKSYKAGIKIGMEKKKLRGVIISSATFTILPSISILLGVIALSGTLGIPLPWLRLSVVGALHYETSVADIAARSYGLSGLNINEMTPTAFATIALVMTVGIIWGMVTILFFLKVYLSKIQKKSSENKPADGSTAEGGENGEKTAAKPKKNLGDVMMAAMFIGLISAYIGSYFGTFRATHDFLPLVTVAASAVVMAVFELLIKKRGFKKLENFSVAASMLIGMVVTVLVGLAV